MADKKEGDDKVMGDEEFALAFDASIDTKEEPPKEEPPKEEPPKEEPPKVDPAEATAKAVSAALAARDAADTAKTKTAAEAEEVAAAAKKALKPTKEEKKSLDSLDKEFPDVAEALAVKERIMLTQVGQMISKGIADGLAALRTEFAQQIAPLASSTAKTAQERFDADVNAVHPDAYELIPEVEKWIATQPEFLQAGYNQVLDKSTAKATNELYTMFKEATGRTETSTDAAEKAAATAKAAAEKKEREDEKKKKLDSQEGVRSRSSAKSEGTDEDDFDGAFHELAAASSH